MRRAVAFGLILLVAIATVRAQASGATSARSLDKGGMEYARIPAGSFEMGCVSGDTCESDEFPTHTVHFARPFFIAKTETTVSAYAKFAKETGRDLPKAPDFNSGWSQRDQPMVRLKWEDAQAYCAWSGGRLPTEAEWEYAARGGLSGKKFPWGDESPVCREGASNGARFDDDEGCAAAKGSQSTAVGKYGANGYGLVDVTGNAWEWVQDNYHETYAGAPADGSAATGSGLHGLRGGSWILHAKDLRVSNRYRDTSGERYLNSGVRCVRDPS